MKHFSTNFKRYLSLYDLVRNAYAKRDETEATIADYVREQELILHAANERKSKPTQPTPEPMQETNVISDDSSNSNKSGKNSKIKTKPTTRQAKKAPELTKK